MHKSFIMQLIIAACCISTAVFAHDLVPPAWRGYPGTTFQTWTFDDAEYSALPEIISNPFGAAIAGINVGQYGSGWHYQLPGLGTQTGYWDIGGVGGSITIEIDNVPVQNPYKEIWIQITYYDDITGAPDVFVPGSTLVSSELGMLVEHIATGGDWMLDQYVFRIEPNPSHETIQILSDPQWMSVIDQIVVDTYCVAEPASISLLAFGAITFLFRRYKK